MTSPTQQLKDPLDVEKFSDLQPVIAVTAHPDHWFDIASIDLVQWRLKQHHAQMYIFFFSLLHPTYFCLRSRVAVGLITCHFHYVHNTF